MRQSRVANKYPSSSCSLVLRDEDLVLLKYEYTLEGSYIIGTRPDPTDADWRFLLV